MQWRVTLPSGQIRLGVCLKKEACDRRIIATLRGDPQRLYMNSLNDCAVWVCALLEEEPNEIEPPPANGEGQRRGPGTNTPGYFIEFVRIRVDRRAALDQLADAAQARLFWILLDAQEQQLVARRRLANIYRRKRRKRRVVGLDRLALLRLAFALLLIAYRLLRLLLRE